MGGVPMHTYNVLTLRYSTYVGEHEKYDTRCEEIRASLEGVSEKTASATDNIISKHALQRALTKAQVLLLLYGYYYTYGYFKPRFQFLLILYTSDPITLLCSACYLW